MALAWQLFDFQYANAIWWDGWCRCFISLYERVEGISHTRAQGQSEGGAQLQGQRRPRKRIRPARLRSQPNAKPSDGVELEQRETLAVELLARTFHPFGECPFPLETAVQLHIDSGDRDVRRALRVATAMRYITGDTFECRKRQLKYYRQHLKVILEHALADHHTKQMACEVFSSFIMAAQRRLESLQASESGRV